MRDYGPRATVFRGLRLLDGFSVTLGILIVANNFRPPLAPSSASVWQLMLARVQETSFWWLAVLFLVGSLARLIRSAMRRPGLQALTRELLDAFQRHVFDEVVDPPHHHRVTLFKHVRWNRGMFWLGNGWLKAVQRSGHVARRTKYRWRASDDGKHLEGVAGRTWARDGVVIVQDLPDPLEEGLSPHRKEEAIASYAKKTWADRNWVTDRVGEDQPFARSLCGIPVKVEGRLWGVLMLDSRSAAAKDADEIRKTYGLFGSILGKILERG